MLRPRREITDYSRACEQLIAAAASPDAFPFSQDEIDWIAYYVTEMNNLVDQLERRPKPQALHDRQTIQEFAVASEVVFLTDDLSEGERDSIRQWVSDITTQILGEKQDPQ